MSDLTALKAGSRDSAPDDLVLPFLLEVPALRGRLVRMGPLIDQILSRHDYPEPVAGLLGELLTLAGVLSTLLKYNGIFTLQVKGDGPVSLMVADRSSDGELRGYADFDPEQLEALLTAPDRTPGTAALLGRGHMAFTYDQGVGTERYQGIVELAGESLVEIMQHYFRQSEQLPTALALAAARVGGAWRAGGLMLQQVPEALADGAAPGREQEDHWRRAVLLMATCENAELLDPALTPNDLLYRLFSEERVRVFEPRPLKTGCRCSRARIETVLRSMPRDEVEEMKVEGEVVVTCQFCNLHYRFDQAALDGLYAS